MWMVIGSRVFGDFLFNWRFLIPLKMRWSLGVIWRLKCLCRPLQTCIYLTADKYTFIVPCEMFEEARWDMNKVSVHSDVGTG